MNSPFKKISDKLGIPEDVVEFAVNDYFLNLRKLIANPTHARILTPIGTIFFDRRIVWNSIYNMIHLLRGAPDYKIKRFRELWKIKELELNYRKLTHKINEKRYKSQQNKAWNQGSKFR